MLKILQARLQQYVNWELPDAQAGFKKDRGTGEKIAKICWIIAKAREFQKNIYIITDKPCCHLNKLLMKYTQKQWRKRKNNAYEKC